MHMSTMHMSIHRYLVKVEHLVFRYCEEGYIGTAMVFHTSKACHRHACVLLYVSAHACVRACVLSCDLAPYAKRHAPYRTILHHALAVTIPHDTAPYGSIR